MNPYGYPDYFGFQQQQRFLIHTLLWVLVVIVLTFSIIFVVSCNPIPAHAEDVDMNIIATIESNGNPYAYNPISQARGTYQITPICLNEYNDKHRDSIIIEEQLFNPVYNGVVAFWYMNQRIPQMLKYYALQDTIDARLACYNAGIVVYLKYKQGKRKLPNETINYINKYHKLERKTK